MNKWFFYVPVLFVLLVGALFLYALMSDLDTSAIPTPLKDKPLPEFNLPKVEDANTNVTDDSLKGTPYILNVWATWCITCRVEHPELVRLSENGVNIVGLNYKDSRADALVWLQQYGDPFMENIYDDEGTLGFDLGVTGAPETFFIRSDGTVAHKHIGAIDRQLWDQKLKGIYETL